jgi:hypothetical protein
MGVQFTRVQKVQETNHWQLASSARRYRIQGPTFRRPTFNDRQWRHSLWREVEGSVPEQVHSSHFRYLKMMLMDRTVCNSLKTHIGILPFRTAPLLSSGGK